MPESKPNSVFYLKINRGTDISLKCFWYWVEIVEAYGADFFIIVDNEEVKYQIMNLYLSNGHSKAPKIIPSYRNQLKSVIEDLFSGKWINIGYALLTPFVHAKENNYSSIWNIDADDTMLFAQPQVCVSLLKKAEDHAIKQNIDILGLDFLYSIFCNRQLVRWTFGVTFANMNVDYIKVICDGKKTDYENSFSKFYIQRNIDDYFTYLRNNVK
ncbi:MAG: hypothetical protein LBB94_05705 [Clostridiales bacterium]|jgi:hypothetical protein|nr:hypothetical protein [Clostridiales bacterium]